ncbi:WhiB family transcriptional regulator [Streptacidiphilus jiangxiensis]|uniref:WhiB family transcriptional regulator n=1 Tax=Streptacidiphilus jiangxiensis TaxID=235985 RepID=UPI0009DE7B32|nr:WhiB family transcriptional regulator [Streptacidiphilus jiangxiensis]
MGRGPELPGATEQAWQWQERAACVGLDTRLFFHPSGERGEGYEAREQAAKDVCAACPVLRQCRDYALDAWEPYGVWGGLGEHERLDLLRRRRAARSRRGHEKRRADEARRPRSRASGSARHSTGSGGRG